MPSARRLARQMLDRLAPRGREPRIVFFHVPKCGGTSVEHALIDAIERRQPLRRTNMFHLDPHASRVAAERAGLPLEQHREHVLLYVLGLRNLAYVGGHFPVSQRALALKAPGDVFVTVLRHPYGRFLSNYYYNRFKTGDRAHFGIEQDLEDWLGTEEARYAAAALVRAFAGDRRLWSDRPSQASDDLWRSGVEAAVETVRQFDVVGDIGDLGAFAEALKHRAGLRIAIEHRMKSPRRDYTPFAEQPAHIRAAIADLCRHDVAIYEAVSAGSGARPAEAPAGADGAHTASG